MRLLLCLFACFCLIAPAEAQRVSQEQFVVDIYTKYQAADADPKVKLPDSLSPAFYSARMRKILSTMQRGCKRGDICGPGFDVFVNGQDYKISGIEAKTTSVTEKTATVRATFKNFDQPMQMDFMLVRENSRWVIDDLVAHKSAADSAGYTLSSLLAPKKR